MLLAAGFALPPEPAAWRAVVAEPCRLGRPYSPSYYEERVVEDLKSGYVSLPTEHEYTFTAEEVEFGEVPSELSGSLYRNGPGLMDVQGTTLNQPFDGDGMVLRFTFLDGRVTFRNRFVETEGLRAERRAGKMLFKGAFATGRTVPGLFNPFDFSVKNVANSAHTSSFSRLLTPLQRTLSSTVVGSGRCGRAAYLTSSTLPRWRRWAEAPATGMAPSAARGLSPHTTSKCPTTKGRRGS